MKILIIQSAPIRHYKKALEYVYQTYPGSECWVLTHTSSSQEIESIHPVTLVPYAASCITPWTIPLSLIKQLRKESFDRIVILYTTYFGHGYALVRLTALIIGAGSIEAYNNKGRLFNVTLPSLIVCRMYEMCTFIFYIILWGTLFIRENVQHAYRR